jgi:hypothetical protein
MRTECSICHQYLGLDGQQQLSCNHVFHEICIQDWFRLSTDPSCPLCRTPATRQDYRRERDTLFSEGQERRLLFHFAVKNNCVRYVESFLQSESDSNHYEELEKAIEKGHVATVRLLLNHSHGYQKNLVMCHRTIHQTSFPVFEELFRYFDRDVDQGLVGYLLPTYSNDVNTDRQQMLELIIRHSEWTKFNEATWIKVLLFGIEVASEIIIQRFIQLCPDRSQLQIDNYKFQRAADICVNLGNLNLIQTLLDNFKEHLKVHHLIASYCTYRRDQMITNTNKEMLMLLMNYM